MNNKEQYAFGYSKLQTKMLEQRNFANHYKFIAPYLKPGMKVLDCGCGPGSITIGLAQAIAPGEVVAIDISEAQLEIARESARIAGVTNITFQQANILELPFTDNSFDMTCSQALLMHLSDPVAAVIEQKRVTKNGGLVAARDPYNGHKDLFYPRNQLLEEALILYHQSIIDNGGDLELGIKLKKLFISADLKDIQHTLFCDNYSSEKASALFAQAMIKLPYNQKLIANGKITLEKLQQYQQAWIDFGKVPGAYYGFMWGEAIGLKQEDKHS